MFEDVFKDMPPNLRAPARGAAALRESQADAAACDAVAAKEG